MASILHTIQALLQADTGLAALLPGGIWDRPLIDDASAAATPGAFEDAPASRRGRRIRAAASIDVQGVGVSAAGTALVSALAGQDVGEQRSVTVWLYEPIGNRATIHAAKTLVRQLLQRRQIATDEGGCYLRWIGDLGTARDEDLDAEADYVRFSAATTLGVS